MFDFSEILDSTTGGHIKASALSNSIFLCLIISLLCYGIVFLGFYDKVIRNRLEIDEILMRDHRSYVNYALADFDNLENKSEEVDLFENEVKSLISTRSWGIYNLLFVKTYFKADTLSKAYLLGRVNQIPEKRISLFVTDKDEIVKYSGDIEIDGKVQIPKSKLERSYVENSASNKSDLKINKKLLSNSGKKLPELKPLMLDNFENYRGVIAESNPLQNSKANSFFDKTILVTIESSGILRDVDFKGNIRIISENPLKIDSSAKLEDVIIDAPEVVVGKGFKGSIHIIAQDRVEIMDSVQLSYPSSIIVKHTTGESEVLLRSNSKVFADIVVISASGNSNSLNTFRMEENCQVVGSIYCEGSTELRGSITGSVYTDLLAYQTESSNYKNLLKDLSILTNTYESHFFNLPLKNELGADKNRYDIIKKL